MANGIIDTTMSGLYNQALASTDASNGVGMINSQIDASNQLTRANYKMSLATMVNNAISSAGKMAEGTAR